ncbi:MAG: HIT domain-containing protein [Gammaproteobacteria bacterium]|nr:HIT domain-containing protein [Gammaproteobacteria bacterium]
MSNYDDNNIFAKILRNELSCHQVFEDENTFVLMDIMPRGTGHCLVLPKRPARNILDADDEMLAQVYSTVRKISLASLVAFEADGLTIQQFNESAGGQLVYHLHVHVIPRFDGVKLRPHTGEMESNEILAQNAAKLVEALEAG